MWSTQQRLMLHMFYVMDVSPVDYVLRQMRLFKEPMTQMRLFKEPMTQMRLFKGPMTQISGGPLRQFSGCLRTAKHMGLRPP